MASASLVPGARRDRARGVRLRALVVAAACGRRTSAAERATAGTAGSRQTRIARRATPRCCACDAAGTCGAEQRRTDHVAPRDCREARGSDRRHDAAVHRSAHHAGRPCARGRPTHSGTVCRPRSLRVTAGCLGPRRALGTRRDGTARAARDGADGILSRSGDGGGPGRAAAAQADQLGRDRDGRSGHRLRRHDAHRALRRPRARTRPRRGPGACEPRAADGQRCVDDAHRGTGRFDAPRQHDDVDALSQESGRQRAAAPEARCHRANNNPGASPGGHGPLDLHGLTGNAVTPTDDQGDNGSKAPGQCFSSGQVTQVIGLHQPGIRRACWERNPTTKPTVNVSVSLTIGPDGSPQSVSASADESSVAKCVENDVRSWRFPAMGCSQQTSFSFHFVRQ